jgi:membrane protein YdbS with pleckstrin-like domain
MTAMAPLPSPVRDPAWPLSRGAIGLWVTGGVVASLALGVLVTALLALTPVGSLALLRWLLPAAVLVYAGVAVGVRPWLRWRVHRWEVTAEAVFTLTGWLSRTWTLVPVSRIQTVDVTRGAVQQLFGLATVVVLTASAQGTVRIPHLEADVARRVADDLARRAELVRDEAT